MTWVWRSPTHNVAVESQPAGGDWAGHGGIENTGFTDEHTFAVPGEYRYVCTPHRSGGMVGAVVVS